MKYRRLQSDELQELEKEFIKFLAANQVTAEDWKRIKGEENDKADRLIEIFSDMVFDRVLEDVEYLEHKTPHDLKAFRFGEAQAEMNGLKIEGDSQVDLTEQQNPQQMLQQLQLTGAKLKLYSAEKKYAESKKQEIFLLMENGALISRDGALFKSLESLKA
ncbi:MAG: DUF6495 family protein [Phaeodactylibacter sp.]|uniref:DUF6495 family protein n=1 Tax=Phaeodactylibacter sp. TaxID=1940289 RepID=UPI0032EEAE8C